MVKLDAFEIEGPVKLKGKIKISGAKNSALPCLIASLLTDEDLILSNIPEVQDVKTLFKLFDILNISYKTDKGKVILNAKNSTNKKLPYDLTKKMRASILFLGPLLSRFGETIIPLPGGCAIGQRPVDLHIEGLNKLGAKVFLEHGNINAKFGRIKGGKYTFPKVTVTGTENLVMATIIGKGETVLYNCAQEPEVVDLCNLLTKMGAKIDGIGTSKLTIQAVEKLKGAHHKIIPDRIEAGTYIILSSILKDSSIIIEDFCAEHLYSLLEALSFAGAKFDLKDNFLKIDNNFNLKAHSIVTAPYPGFPTDLQAQYTVAMTQAEGLCTVEERIFENRFNHIMELNRMGADISIFRSIATVKGPVKLQGAPVMASDLRASASLVLAGLVAEGKTRIHRIYHLDRGYYKMEEILNNIGAKIKRIAVEGV